MVKRLRGGLLLGMLLFDASASGKPTSLAIHSVVLVRSGVYRGSGNADPEAARSCSSMKVSPSGVARWFQHANEVPKDGFQERATMTGCSMAGYLITAGGQRYTWELDIGGAGVIHAPEAICLIGLEFSP